MSKPLEKYRFFPIVAWGLVIGFTLFTIHLAVALGNPIAALGEKSQRTSDALRAN